MQKKTKLLQRCLKILQYIQIWWRMYKNSARWKNTLNCNFSVYWKPQMQYFMTHEVETYVLVHLIQHHCRTVDFCYFTESPWHVFQHLVVLLIPLLSVFEAFSITLLQRLTFTKLSKGVLTVGSVAFYHVWAQSPLPPHTSLNVSGPSASVCLSISTVHSFILSLFLNDTSIPEKLACRAKLG